MLKVSPILRRHFTLPPGSQNYSVKQQFGLAGGVCLFPCRGSSKRGSCVGQEFSPFDGHNLAVRKSFSGEMGAIYTQRLLALGKCSEQGGSWFSLALSISRHVNCVEANP